MTKSTPKKREAQTVKKKAAFLAALEKGLSVSGAGNVAKISRTTAYRWQREDEAFAEAWDDALEGGTDLLEDILLQRAKEDSDTLGIFLLKARRPEKYIDRSRINHTHKITEIELIAPDENSSPDTT